MESYQCGFKRATQVFSGAIFGIPQGHEVIKKSPLGFPDALVTAIPAPMGPHLRRREWIPFVSWCFDFLLDDAITVNY